MYLVALLQKILIKPVDSLALSLSLSDEHWLPLSGRPYTPPLPFIPPAHKEEVLTDALQQQN